ARAHRVGTCPRPAMPLGDVLHDREPQPRATALAATGLIDAIETLEDPLEVVMRNANALVAHGDDQPIVFLLRRHPDMTPRIAVGNSILEQIDQGLFEQWGIDRST